MKPRDPPCHTIAMGHAPEAVRRAAHVVVGDHAADGWAEAVERFALGGGEA